MTSIERNLIEKVTQDLFGATVSKITGILVSRGRLTAAQISSRTQLPLSRVHQSLFILVQHHLVTFAEQEEGTRVTLYYSPHVKHLLLLPCLPLVLVTIQELFGEVGLQLVRLILEHGRMTSTALFEMCQEQGLSRQDAATTFQQMLARGFIISVSPDALYTLTDTLMYHERQAITSQNRILSANEKLKIRKEIAAKNERGELPTRSGSMSSLASAGSSKKKFVYDLDDLPMVDEAGSPVTPDTAVTASMLENAQSESRLHFKFNWSKLAVVLRSNDLVRLATRRVNASAGSVMKVMLQHFERQMYATDSMPRTPAMSWTEVKEALLESGAESLKVEELNAAEAVQVYLEYLCHDEVPFVYKDSELGGGAFSVLLEKQTKRLKLHVVLSIIKDKFGAIGQRLWMILYTKGKLEEKQVSKFCMAPIKDVRECLSAMALKNYCYIQDVPKSNDHTPARTFFLWAVDLEMTVQMMIQELYKTLLNVRLRRGDEVKKHQMLVDKLSRKDVQENMEELLSEGEKKEMAMMQRVNEVLWLAEVRVAESVVVLRDY